MTPGPSSVPSGAPEDLHSSSLNSSLQDQPQSSSSNAGAQPKTCAICGLQLDPPPTNLSSADLLQNPSGSAPSPSSIAFAPEPHQSLTSAINAAAAAALSRHLGGPEGVEGVLTTDADGHAICSHCAASSRHGALSRDRSPLRHSVTAQDREDTNTRTADQGIDVQDGTEGIHSSQSGRSVATGTFPGSTREHLVSLTEEGTTGASRQDSMLGTVDRESAANASSASASNPIAIQSSQATTTPRSPTSPTSPWRRAPWTGPASPTAASTDGSRLSISVSNMGAGGDAAMFNPTDDSDFPPLRRPGTSPPTLRSPTSPGRSPTRDRGRLRFGSPPASTSRGYSGEESTSPILGRSGSFSRSLSYSASGPDGGRNSSASAVNPVVSFPTTSSASNVVHGFSPSGAPPRARRSSSSSGTANVPAPAGAIPGAAKTRRPSVTRRLSRSSSSTAPTSLPFAAMGTSSAEIPAFAIEEDPFGPSSMSRPRLSTIPAHAISEALNGNSTLVGSSVTSFIHSATSARDSDKVIKLLPNTLGYPYYEQAQSNSESMQVDKPETGKIRIDEARWYDPLRPDPVLHICRIRAPPKSRGCLYPGALFNGTQKSGRNSYDVTVRIVNVDLEASHLCGYLNIRGLTEDWPELTTYFDAEIIGDRHGFVTGKWGATEADDLKHWARFQPFRPLRSALSKPGLRFNHLNKPYVFMRWKERFLVPDHRVRDINGASFAGFYYVCVELGESGQRPSVERNPSSQDARGSGTTSLLTASPPGQQPYHWYLARANRRREREHQQQVQQFQQQYAAGIAAALSASPSIWPPSPPSGSGSALPTSPRETIMDDPMDTFDYNDVGTAGKMSGFYFHENSEPYQQLSLHHVPEKSSGGFELR